MAAIDEIRLAGNATSERAARATLRAQIAKLEREVSAALIGAYPRLDPSPPIPSFAGPRLLSLGELERIRDALAARLGALHAAAAEQAARQAVALAELEQMLAGIVLLVVGLFKFDSRQGKTMLVVGLALGSLGGLDTAAREHFAGFKSHTAVLAGVPAVAVAAVLYFAELPWPVVTVAAVATFAGAFWLLWRAYQRKG